MIKTTNHQSQELPQDYNKQAQRITSDNFNVILRQQREIEEMQKQIQVLTLQTQNSKADNYFDQRPRITRTFDVRNQYPNPFAINVYPGAINRQNREDYRNTPYPRPENYYNQRQNPTYPNDRPQYKGQFEQRLYKQPLVLRKIYS